MGYSDFLYSGFISRLGYQPTVCQDRLMRKVADFVTSDDSDILVVNGYAGTGKTTAITNADSWLTEKIIIYKGTPPHPMYFLRFWELLFWLLP